MDAVKYLYERKRMCEAGCYSCGLLKDDGPGTRCGFSDLSPERAIRVVEQWSAEHPVKNRADKFREVFGVDINDLAEEAFYLIDETTGDHAASYLAANLTITPTSYWWTAEYREPEKGEA